MWFQGKDILVEKASKTAQSNEASVVALRHNMALIPMEQLFGGHGGHGGRRAREQRRVAATVSGEKKCLGREAKDI
ncbi:hypothetical protein NW765_017568 [Fusarium oxysporum]|nr:hypothetical protein NW765_017568 [Fusarium oxysporum]